MTYKRFNLINTPIDSISKQTLFDRIEHFIDIKRDYTVFYLNVHAFNIFQNDLLFQSEFKSADAIISDSDFIRMMCEFYLKIKIPKLTPSRWVIDLLSETKKPITVFLLGEEESVLNKTLNKLKVQFPTITFVGHHGFFDQEKNFEIVELINRSKADILIVAMGMPKQESFLINNKKQLTVPIKITVGGAFKYWANIHPQAPKLFLMFNLEWLHRIYLEPKRLFKRYLKDSILFLQTISKYSS